MVPINAHWPTVFQTATHWEIIDNGQLPADFYQFLLTKARQGAHIALVYTQRNTGLQDQFYINFEQAGGHLYLSDRNPPLAAASCLSVDAVLYYYSAKNGFEVVHGAAQLAAFQQTFNEHLSRRRYDSDIRFYTTPSVVLPNDSFELCWEVPGADEVQITPLLGSVANKGRKRLSTESEIRFTLHAQYGHKSKTVYTDIAIDPKPKIEYLLAVPDRAGEEDVFLRPQIPGGERFAILERQAIRLYWRVFHADHCTVNAQPVPASGNMIFHPAEPMHISITARGPQGYQETNIVLDVFNRPVLNALALPAPAQISVHTELKSPVFEASQTGVKKTKATPLARQGRNTGFDQKSLRHFLWFCAGADADLLEAAPVQERAKYAGIGGAVFFTGLLAAVSGGYALYVAFNNPYAALLFALLWGAVIFNIDRLVVASIRQGVGGKSPWRQALPRMALALILSVVIAKPMELRIFEPEIQEILTERKNRKLQKLDRLYQQKQAGKQAEIDRLHAAEQSLYAAKEARYQEYRCECDGTCGTGKTGVGSECKRKEAKYRQADAEYQQQKQANEPLTASLRQDMNRLQGEALLAAHTLTRNHATGLAARLDASGDLPFWPGFFISLLIFLVEIAPIMSKILAPAGVYEAALAAKSRRYAKAQSAEDTESEEQAQHQTELRTRLRALEIDQELEQHRIILRMIADAQAQVVQKQVKDWMDGEKGKG